MNTPLRRVGLAMLAMVVLLLANATYIHVVKAADYRDDPRNQRQLLYEYSRERGQIVSQFGGTILAQSSKTNDRLQYLRKYRSGPMYAPITGYYSWRYGSDGMERASNDILTGEDERLIVRRLSDIITGRDPRGGHVQVTIDPAVQQAAYNAMVSRGFTGSVVALRPDTGEILGMVSTPSYDPNKLASHDGDKQEQAWASWNCDPAAPNCTHNNPMLNRSVQQTYPPGSTFKLVVTAAALESGMTMDTPVESASEVPLPGTTGITLENYAGATCPGSTLRDALAYSCNTAFAKLAEKLGAQKLRSTARKFGIGMDDLSIPLDVEQSHLGPLDSSAVLYQSGIGQRDVRLTPLQDAMLSATIANGGVTMKPQLVKELLAPDLSTLEEYESEELMDEPALSSQNAEVLRDMMIASEANTSGEGKRSDLTIASKTGTAEHGADPKNTPPHAWYTAFAPAHDPKVAVAVIVESGGDRGLAATGGSVAAGIGRLTINAALGEG
ncbi:MAG: penicillin-binding protein 2 [Actinophytocola sp.]|nr:penicillin-binding protein 2 [Actinophytocola sp.]